MKYVFIVATDGETAAVTSCFVDAVEDRIGGYRVIRGRFRGEETALVVSGIGKTNAAAAAQFAIDRFTPEHLFNAGTAGGMRPGMKRGETYTARQAVQWDFDLSALDGRPKGTLEERKTPFFDLDPVPGFPEETVATGDRFSDDPEEPAYLVSTWDAGIREMELAAICHVAERAGIRVSSLKMLADVVGGEDSMTGQYAASLSRVLSGLALAVSRWSAEG